MPFSHRIHPGSSILRPLVAVAVLPLIGATLVACGTAANDAAAAPQENDHEAHNAGDPISMELLTPRAAFTDEVAAQIRLGFEGLDTVEADLANASHIAVAEITIQPGAVFPWHTHPGPVFITIAEGDFVYRLAEDCVDRAYTSGQALVDIGGENVHSAYNPSSDSETVVIATFLGAPDEGPLTVPVDGPDPADCPLPAP